MCCPVCMNKQLHYRGILLVCLSIMEMCCRKWLLIFTITPQIVMAVIINLLPHQQKTQLSDRIFKLALLHLGLGSPTCHLLQSCLARLLPIHNSINACTCLSSGCLSPSLILRALSSGPVVLYANPWRLCFPFLLSCPLPMILLSSRHTLVLPTSLLPNPGVQATLFN